MSARAGHRKATNRLERDTQRVPPLRVHITKRVGGGAVLNCVRADGTTAWQKQDGHQGVFFPFHDLTHYAVETVLGFRRGFYGMLAEGREIRDMEEKGARARMPAETLLVEHIVGFFDRERASRAKMSAEEFNLFFAGLVAEKRVESARVVTDDELDAVRVRVKELHREWGALAEGGTLELAFGEHRDGGVIRRAAENSA